MTIEFSNLFRNILLRLAPAARWVTCAVLILPLAAAAATPEERYAEVRAAFEKHDFTRAQYLAERMLDDKHLSPQLFQLLGHIRYRQGDLGRATLWYSRASLFPPPVPEIRQNISYIHERTGNLRFPANTFLDQFSAMLSRTQWAYLAAISGWVVIFAIALCILIRAFALRTLLMLLGVVALGTTAVASLGWAWHPSYKKIENLAVITAPGAKAFTAATVTSGSVIPLPPGSEVRKLEERGAWCYVEIPPNPLNSDDRGHHPSLRGWVQIDAFTDFWPREFDPGYLE